MQITVTNASATLNSLLSAAQRQIAETNRGGATMYQVTIVNLSTADTIYTESGGTATTNSTALQAGASGVAGDSRTYTTGDLNKIRLLSSGASTSASVEIEPFYT